MAHRALGELCEIYWKPVYAYIRGRGWKAEEAEDLTQEFFACFLERKGIESADESLGKLRAFLLSSVKRFLVDETRKKMAQKRGGGSEQFSMDHGEGERSFSALAANEESPEVLYERAWVRTLIDEVTVKLEAQYVERGKGKEFVALKPSLLREEDALSQRELGWELGMSLAAVKVAVFRLRQRFRELLEKEIAQTVEEGGEVDAEVIWLMGVWKKAS
ncbi:RNA polymerase sigma factor [Roseibacillus persicicus]|uniref:RNA polymerase sigma factor n=1 Tax=Roseibacillus persicicus TaxID=454148 RepID=UPI002810379C|nr:sigma-70 family RNA polymerase sigma factor [Roseibacillus persicicus]MDQ8189712.1 sigma-70 family RNA polymerase sigma factor [Roseibacillus persicicus]